MSLLFRDDSSRGSHVSGSTQPDGSEAFTSETGQHDKLVHSSSSRSVPTCTSQNSTLFIAFIFVWTGLLITFYQFQPHTMVPSKYLKLDSTPFRSPKTLKDILDLKRPPSELLEHSDVEFCPHTPEPDTLERVPEKFKYLMVIGSQKAGTTWLYNALEKHPAFIPTMRRPGKEYDLSKDDGLGSQLLRKEPKFFNRWPLPPTEWYMHSWDAKTLGDILGGKQKNKVLLDGSPQYLMVPSAAARVKASVPQAKFVIVVRDPPMRTMSDYKMMHRMYPRCQKGNSRLCPQGTFLETIEAELKDRASLPECLFNSEVSDDVTWMECFRCSFNFIDVQNEPAKTACQNLEGATQAEILQSTASSTTYEKLQDDDDYSFGPEDTNDNIVVDRFDCGIPHFGFIDQSKYAAQFAWWLRFFPPERFMFVSSWQLHDEEESLKVLNQILEHAEVGNAESAPFTADIVHKAKAFNGGYKKEDFSADDHKALAILREHFQKDQEDLKSLVDMLYPELNFTIQLES